MIESLESILAETVYAFLRLLCGSRQRLESWGIPGTLSIFIAVPDPGGAKEEMPRAYGLRMDRYRPAMEPTIAWRAPLYSSSPAQWEAASHDRTQGLVKDVTQWGRGPRAGHATKSRVVEQARGYRALQCH